jgi:16S rRNA (uracil1498-N3)-methyltransferase
MHRFYLPPASCQGETLLLSGSEAHHALHVLRVRYGETVVVLDGAGAQYRCEVQSLTRDTVNLSVLEKKQHPAPPCSITLLQAVPKGKLIETIIQKATELGVSRIVPLLTERTLLQVDGKDAQRKAAKWQSVAIEAIKQCGSPWLPEVLPPMPPAEFLKRKEHSDLPLIGCLLSGSKHPREYFDAFLSREGRKPESVSVWIGPEGDFTPTEYDSIQAAGALPITLGPLILRTDTAATYCLSLINYELSAPLASA